jgi:hypothetical protein
MCLESYTVARVMKIAFAVPSATSVTLRTRGSVWTGL